MTRGHKHYKVYKLGLTGSIGMGKTTVAKVFSKAKIPVWNADKVVENLYKKNAEGYQIIASIVPEAIDSNSVNKTRLSDAILRNKILLREIEEKVHPLLKKSRDQFIDKFSRRPLIVFEIPLLYETKSDKWLDAVLVVTAPKRVQKARVMKREAMTEEKLDFFLARQLKESVRLSKADYVINTDVGMNELRAKVKEFIKQLEKNVRTA